MKPVFALTLMLISFTCSAYTVKSDFLRCAKTFENAQFPLDIEGYLDLTFRISLKTPEVTHIVRALVERRINGKTESYYTGDFECGKKIAVTFDDGSVGPHLMFIDSDLQKTSSTVSESSIDDESARILIGKAVAVRTKN